MDQGLNLSLGMRVLVGGKEVYRNDDDPLLIAFIDILWQAHQASSTVSVYDTSNQSRNISNNPAMRADASDGTTNYGIVVGAGQTAVSITNYKLGSQFGHGVGSNQLLHGPCMVSSAVTVGTTTRYVTVDRMFSNVSGAQITVYEVGLYVYGGSYYFCFARDLISGGAAIPNGEIMAVQYRFSVTV